jgi:hypothetical protein
MICANVPKVPSSLVQAIQDAVLLGGAKEIDALLESIKDDKNFPDTIRYGLEAMFYFRHYYGKDGELEPKNSEDKKRLFEMEALWGRELIESLDCYSEVAETKYA